MTSGLSLNSWPVFLGLSGLTLTLIFAGLDPGVSEGVSGAASLLFWGLQVFGLLSIFAVLQVGLTRLVSPVKAGPWLQIAVVALAGSAVFTPVAMVLDQLFGVAPDPAEAEQGIILAFLDEFTALAPPATLCWLALNAVPLLRLEPLKGRAVEAEPGQPAFWERVPTHLGQTLCALSAELHYLRVYTDKGDALILYPFGQAVEDVADAGVQIHRSHWVADAAVEDVETQGRSMSLRLKTGLSLPVSRSRMAAIRTRFEGRRQG
ncbi:LytTR family DNA-binding domain-containing protein [Thalassococcus sp. S3]|uniref:LytTR family DNA-binding domain-containing protein n=1 Tax=Thalassococcus sp. S3 TaxID=2017482 RepID=UPI0013EE44CA|nr:LytTR family DNA-binding domain-containing protein [Thalassococcus sp. S3]